MFTKCNFDLVVYLRVWILNLLLLLFSSYLLQVLLVQKIVLLEDHVLLGSMQGSFSLSIGLEVIDTL